MKLIRVAWLIILDSKKGKVLIIKRSGSVNNPYRWCFPGGSSKKLKSKRLAKKEAKQEVGIKVKGISLILKVPLRIKKHFFYVYYSKKGKTPIVLNYESSKYKWIKLSKLHKQRRLHRSVKVFLENYEQRR